MSTLIRWFPDRRGMATGLAIMGFGGGAILGAPLAEVMLRFYFVAPDYLGAIGDVLAECSPQRILVPVVVASRGSLSRSEPLV